MAAFRRPSRLGRVVPVVLITTFGLSACLPLAAVPGAIVGAVGLYCAVTSEEGKAMARGVVSDGVPLIACPEPDQEPDHAPDQEPAPESEPTPAPTS